MTALTPLALKKSYLQKIFGSNLLLSHRAVRGTPQDQWAAVIAARTLFDKRPKHLHLIAAIQGGFMLGIGKLHSPNV